MQFTQNKEDISISYISALCACASIDYDIIRHDDDSTDGILKKIIILDNGKKFNSQLRIQLKCTSSVSQYKDNGDSFTYKLKSKNYNDLCTSSTMPVILGLLILPQDESLWINWTTEELIMKGCMYWAEFSNEDPSNNGSTVSVTINKNNVINVDSLQYILKRIAEEEWP